METEDDDDDGLEINIKASMISFCDSEFSRIREMDGVDEVEMTASIDPANNRN